MVLLGLRASNKHTQDDKCVVWIDAIDTTHTLWPQIETELRAILPSDISIEIWQASNRLLCTTFCGEVDPILADSSDIAFPDQTAKDIASEFFDRPPNPGCSIGVTGEKRGTGTLGGYVKVVEQTADANGISTPYERVYALTCAHVALGGSPLFADLMSKGRVRYGKDDSLCMQAPSVEDCTRFRKVVEEEVTRHKADINDFDKKMNQCCSMNEIRAAERFRKLGAASVSRLTHAEQKSEWLSQDHYLGSVRAAAFGKRAHQLRDNLAMDIALIDVTELNVIPKLCDTNGKWPFGEKGCYLFEKWEMVNLSRRLVLNDTVAKIGTSGVTTGSLHNIEGNIDISLGKELQKSLAVYVVHYSSRCSAFALPDDSGSFVFAETYSSDDTRPKEHRVLGLLIGATRNGLLGYFIPFDAVIDEIEALTGGKVTWPLQCV